MNSNIVCFNALDDFKAAYGNFIQVCHLRDKNVFSSRNLYQFSGPRICKNIFLFTDAFRCGYIYYISIVGLGLPWHWLLVVI